LTISKTALDHSKGFGGKFGVQTDRKDQSATGWDEREQMAKHESQTGGLFHVTFTSPLLQITKRDLAVSTVYSRIGRTSRPLAGIIVKTWPNTKAKLVGQLAFCVGCV
jgi:hypothetical protein